jgi:anti-sigma factor RsiW
MLKHTHTIEQEELMAYLDGELLVDRAVTAAAHLESCRECQELAAVLQSVTRRMMARQVDPSDLVMRADIAVALGSKLGDACPNGNGDWQERR